MEILLSTVTALFYGAAIALVIPGLAHQHPIRRHPVLFAAGAALLCHGWLLHDLILTGGGQNLSILNVASLISFLIALATTIAIPRTRVWFLLPVVYSASIINELGAAFIPGNYLTHLQANPSLLIHISLALFTYATLMIATLYAIQLVWLDYRLKNKKDLVPNPNLPPLMRIERQLFRLLLIGQAMLTITLVTGLLFVQDIFAQGKAHKAILSMLAWCVYSLLIWGHYQRNWRGRHAVWYSLIGAFLLTLAYFGSRFVKEVILS